MKNKIEDFLAKVKTKVRSESSSNGEYEMTKIVTEMLSKKEGDFIKDDYPVILDECINIIQEEYDQ